MDLDQLLDTCAQSTPDDWSTITTWGARSGPSYLDHFHPGEYGGEFQLRHSEHSMRAAYRPDVSIGLAWGLDPDNVFPDDSKDFEDDWSQKFPDKKFNVHYLDVFFNGNLVHREMYVVVDGGRAALPAPDHKGEVTQRSHDLIRLIDQISGYVSDYDRYFDQSGFKIA